MAQYALTRASGYQQVDAATLASATPLTLPNGSIVGCLLRVEGSGASVRFRDDGVAPDADTGMPLSASDEPFGYFGNVSALQFIAAAGSPTLDVLYYAK
jgi:hypothetical protein